MKTLVRIALAALALVLAALALALADDIGSHRATLEDGDARMAADPAVAVDWTTSTLLPSDPAGSLLDVGHAIDLRRAVRSFVIADRTGRGFDSGQTRARRAAAAEALLQTVTLEGTPLEASQADDLLGILAFGTGTSPAGVASPGQRSLDAFTAAARLDPGNEAAKLNLEIALRALAPHGTRTGSNPGTGALGTGSKGAGAGVPGRGY